MMIGKRERKNVKKMMIGSVQCLKKYFSKYLNIWRFVLKISTIFNFKDFIFVLVLGIIGTEIVVGRMIDGKTAVKTVEKMIDVEKIETIETAAAIEEMIADTKMKVSIKFLNLVIKPWKSCLLCVLYRNNQEVFLTLTLGSYWLLVVKQEWTR